MSLIIIEMKHSEPRRRFSLTAVHVLIMNIKMFPAAWVHGTKGYTRAEIGKDAAQVILSSLQRLERRIETCSWNHTRSSTQFFVLVLPVVNPGAARITIQCVPTTISRELHTHRSLVPVGRPCHHGMITWNRRRADWLSASVILVASWCSDLGQRCFSVP
jgi:hypothetical protein